MLLESERALLSRLNVLLSRLNAGLEAYRPLLKQAAEEAFQKRFRQFPDVHLVQAEASFGLRRGLVFSMVITVDYGNLLATAYPRRNVEIPEADLMPDVELIQAALQKVEDLCRMKNVTL